MCVCMYFPQYCQPLSAYRIIRKNKERKRLWKQKIKQNVHSICNLKSNEMRKKGQSMTMYTKYHKRDREEERASKCTKFFGFAEALEQPLREQSNQKQNKT